MSVFKHHVMRFADPPVSLYTVTKHLLCELLVFGDIDNNANSLLAIHFFTPEFDTDII